MTFRILFEGEAEAELKEAISYYDANSEALGDRFANEVRAMLHQASKNPQRFPFAGPTTQKIKMVDWPYSIYFTLLQDSGELIVVSVFEGAQDPAKIRKRLK